MDFLQHYAQLCTALYGCGTFAGNNLVEFLHTMDGCPGLDLLDDAQAPVLVGTNTKAFVAGLRRSAQEPDACLVGRVAQEAERLMPASFEVRIS